MVISICGKGGTGKSTLAALIIRRLRAERIGSVLAVDGDPNSTLGDILGVKSGQSIVGIVDEISSKMGEMPAGMTKERYIDMRIQEALTEEDGFDLLVMGRPEGPGCYCYVNNLLRGLLARLMKSYDFVVIDNEAGMEHISRRTTRVADILIVVSDLSAIGVRSAGRIYELAKDIGMKFKCAFLVVNRADGDAKALSHEIARVGIPLAGEIPYSESLYKGGLKGESIFKLADKAIDDSVEKIFKETGIWSCCATNTPPR